jgi:hypothetical protein
MMAPLARSAVDVTSNSGDRGRLEGDEAEGTKWRSDFTVVVRPSGAFWRGP